MVVSPVSAVQCRNKTSQHSCLLFLSYVSKVNHSLQHNTCRESTTPSARVCAGFRLAHHALPMSQNRQGGSTQRPCDPPVLA